MRAAQSRRHFYGEAEKLLAFFNSKHIGAPVVGLDGSLRTPGMGLDASIRGPSHAPRVQPFFLGEEDSLADYFLFSLIDDDQRIAECLVTSNSSSKSSSSNSSEGATNGEGREKQPQQTSTEAETGEVVMHYFDETPYLHALYLALLNMPLIQEALLSSDVQDLPAATTAHDEAIHDSSGEGKDRLGPCVATEASTAASVSDSPLQQLQRQQMMQLQQQQQQLLQFQQQQQQIKHLQQLGTSHIKRRHRPFLSFSPCNRAVHRIPLYTLCGHTHRRAYQYNYSHTCIYMIYYIYAIRCLMFR